MALPASTDGQHAGQQPQQQQRRRSIAGFAEFVVSPPQVSATPEDPMTTTVNTAQRLLHCLNLLGVGVALSAILAIFAIAVERLDWTILNDEGVPVLNQKATARLWVPFVVLWSVGACANIANLTASTAAGPRKALWPAIVSLPLIVIAGLAGDPIAEAVNMRYYGATMYAFVLLVTLFTIVDALGRATWRARDERRAREQQQRSPARAGEELNPKPKSSASWADVLTSFAPIAGTLIICFAYPMYLMPLYISSGITTRLFMCLLLHPILLEANEALSRASSAEKVVERLRAGKTNLEQAEARVVQNSLAQFTIKQFMAVFRRLMLLNVGGYDATIFALVAASLEEALSRGFLVELDTRLRRWMKRPTLTGDALRLQRLVWMCDVNLSAIAEFNAIISSSFVQMIMQPHALVFSLGYTAPAESGGVLDAPSAFIQLMLELTLEVLVDTTAMWVENEHGIPVTEYFRYSPRLLPLVFMVCFTPLAYTAPLYAFMRTPTIVTCPSSSFVCDCVDQPQFDGWYDGICARLSNGTELRNTTLAIAHPVGSEEDMFAGVDASTIVVALMTGIAMLALVSLSVLFARYRRNLKTVQDISIKNATLRERGKEYSEQIRATTIENAELKRNLLRSKEVVASPFVCTRTSCNMRALETTTQHCAISSVFVGQDYGRRGRWTARALQAQVRRTWARRRAGHGGLWRGAARDLPRAARRHQDGAQH